MPIPSNITDLSTTPASNSPAGSENPIEGDNHIRTVYAFIRQLYDGITASGVVTDAEFTAFQADLADTSSASNGDFLLGVKKTATGAVARTQHAANNDRFTLRDFGATGDGIADDTAAWQLAIDSGIDEIHGVPGDTYLINSLAAGSPTTVGSGVRYALYYSGTASFRFVGNGATILRTDITYGTGVDEYFKFITTGTVEFTGWHFVGHGTPGSTVGAGRPIQYIFHLETTTGFRLAGNTMQWCGITELYGCLNSVIEGNLYTDTSGVLNTFKHGASTYTDGLIVSKNIAYRSEFDVIDLNDATRNFVIDGNLFEDANHRNYTSDSIDWDEFIDLGGTSLPIYNGVISNNVMREVTGYCSRGIHVKQDTAHVVIANNIIAWDAGDGPKQALNDGITFNFAGQNITVTGNQITGWDAGIATRFNPNDSNTIISDNNIQDVREAGIWVTGLDLKVSGNKVINVDTGITATLYGIRVDDASGCSVDGNTIDLLNAATASFGVMLVSSASLEASSVKNNIVKNCALGIRHFGGSCAYNNNNIQRCYGAAFNATNGGKSVQFVGNYMADNWRSGSPLTVGGLACTYTVETNEIGHLICSNNMIAENTLNTERGTIRLIAGGAGDLLVCVGNICTTDTSTKTINSPSAWGTTQAANNIPAYGIVP